MPRIPRQQRVLVHQVHPAKLATDVGASVISLVLLWQHRLLAGLVFHYVPPVIGSLAVLRFAEVDRLAFAPTGRYVLRHMPPLMVALRLAGDTIALIAAWQQRPTYVVVGLLFVAAGWSHGLLTRARLFEIRPFCAGVW